MKRLVVPSSGRCHIATRCLAEDPIITPPGCIWLKPQHVLSKSRQCEESFSAKVHPHGSVGSGIDVRVCRRNLLQRD